MLQAKILKERNKMKKYKYIQIVPKPLLDDFVNGRVIPFVGAGFSKNANISGGKDMPDWKELGEKVAGEIIGYEYENNAIETLSYYEDLYSRSKLVELLMKELHFGEAWPGDTHKAFCDLFTGTICTTNFDSLIEDEMTFLHRPFSVVTSADRLGVSCNEESKIIKLHGDFNHPDKMVITEKDYDLYLSNNPIMATYIANMFITNTMLLVGYSLDDSDFRGIWRIINNRLGSMAQPAYCITVNASEEKRARYQQRNIKTINLPGKAQEYKIILHDFFVEIKDYINRERDKLAKSTDERVNEQMIIPPEDNKLCFISCSNMRKSQLYDLLAPILRPLGISMVGSDNLLMPGDNIIDAVRTAIRKSKAAIVDVSDASDFVMTELEIIKSEKFSQNVMLICQKGVPLPNMMYGQTVLHYDLDEVFCRQDEIFKSELEKWANVVFGLDIYNSRNFTFEDAHRLFDKKEYSACIVSACSELEHQIYLNRQTICDGKKDNKTKLTSSNYYVKKFYVDNPEKGRELINLRNRIVHENYSATRKEAKNYLSVIEMICQRYEL